MKNNFPGITLIRTKKWFSVGLPPVLAVVFISFGSCSDNNGSKQLMGSGYGINGTTLLVNDLKTTRDYYADTLGFDMPKPDKFDTVFSSGRSTTIHFADFSSMEFISIADSAAVESKYAFIKSFLKEQEGVRTYSL